jgi:hypothetical protein
MMFCIPDMTIIDCVKYFDIHNIYPRIECLSELNSLTISINGPSALFVSAGVYLTGVGL